MRVLLVSHTCTDPSYWGRLNELGQRVDLGVLTPPIWPGDPVDPSSPVPPKPAGASWRQFQLPAVWNGYQFRYFFSPLHLDRLLRGFRPQLVHVEQEPESLSLLQFGLFKLRHHYRLVFFSAENVVPLRRGWVNRYVSFRSADAGIIESQGGFQRCRRLGFRKGLANISPYGFSIEPRSDQASGRREVFTVGYAGRLVPEKGVACFVEAVGVANSGSNQDCTGPRRVEALLAGDGPLHDALISKPLVRMLGRLPREGMEQFWSSIDVLVLPSLTTPTWAEQFGRVIVEAMAKGVPVIGSSSGAIPEVIGDAGLVFPEGDSGALALAIEKLRDSVDLRVSLTNKGLERVRQLYTDSAVAEQTVLFYERVMNARIGTNDSPVSKCDVALPPRESPCGLGHGS